MPRTSVIVPVYNVKDYLEKCVHSILTQTDQDFELLLIDDGSTDGSGALCDRIAERDPRIRVIHQENQGLGGARNTGIRAAAGQWLLMPDSDDWLEPEILERAIAAGERENAGMVIFGLRAVDEEGKTLWTLTEGDPNDQGTPLSSHKEILLTSPSANNKLYQRSLFVKMNMEYPNRVWYEDLRTTPKLMTEAGNIVFIEDVGYNYLQRSGSIMNSSDVARNREILDAFDDLLAWFQRVGLYQDYREELCYMAVCHIYLTASVRVLRQDRKHPLLRRFAAYMAEQFPDYARNPYLGKLTRNQKIIFALLERKQYALLSFIFKLKYGGK